MSMSLTISQPTRTEFGNRFTHEFNPRISLAKSRFSPKPRADSSSPVSSLQASATPSDDKMSATHPHRGLPPPSAMTLPDPRRDGPPTSLTQPLGAMPAPPTQWSGQEESMRNWLIAKAEEDKRKQEEQKTQQESLRLEQRKIEQAMLRESLHGGVPPSMVPMIYAGIGGANLANVSLDWLQQYAAHLQAAQQQQIQQVAPEVRRDPGRLMGAPVAGYAVAQPNQQQVLPSQPTEQPMAAGPVQTTFSAYQPTSARPSKMSAPRSATHTQLPRLTTNEVHVHQPVQPGAGGTHPLQQTQTIQQDQPASSPSIYFHHWVPPSETKGSGNQPQTPASRGEPHSAHPGSSLHDSEYRESPRKRKAQGGHQANPPPSAGPQYTSPPFSTTSSTSGRKGAHTRSRSNASAGRDTDSRPDTSSSRRDDLQSGLRNPPESAPSHASEDSSQRPPSRLAEEPPGRSSLDASRQREASQHPETSGPGSS